ncbi:MAG: fumarylacetoacetate hydrolase family protein [Rhodobacteraceae bacterium]|nr:fumarylacetoacetate hydrolase family protein [Paracoccaceae bacterium]
MTEFVIARAADVGLPVVGTDAVFPVRRVYCIGRNYAAHTVEMGGDPDREEPFFFQKNAENLDPSGVFPYPHQSGDVHHEVEMAVAMAAGGRGLAVEDALDCVFGYALCLDMTRRDVQAKLKKQSRPWEAAKAFEHSAPVGPIHTVAHCGHPARGRITLSVNGTIRQDGDLDQMIWKVPEIIAYLSETFELAGGDVILTGTPSGVGAVERGDLVEIAIAGLGSHRVQVR